jgi:hypothetical protein
VLRARAANGLVRGEQCRIVFGLARNERLGPRAAVATGEAERLSRARGAPARVFRDFECTAKDSWSHRYRAIAEAEWVAVGTAIARRPARTDPGVRLSRTRLLSKVERDGCVSRGFGPDR